MGLRNEIKHFVQQVRKELDFDIESKIECFIEIKHENSIFMQLTSPNIFSDHQYDGSFGLTCFEYLEKECGISKLIISNNDLFFNGIYPVHDKKLVKYIVNKELELVKEEIVNFDFTSWVKPVSLKIFKLK